MSDWIKPHHNFVVDSGLHPWALASMLGRRIAVNACEKQPEQRDKREWGQDGGSFRRGWKAFEAGKDTGRQKQPLHCRIAHGLCGLPPNSLGASLLRK